MSRKKRKHCNVEDYNIFNHYSTTAAKKKKKKSIEVTLRNVSLRTRKEISQAIERALAKESNEKVFDPTKDSDEEEEVNLLFSDIVCIDRIGAMESLPINAVQSAYQWEAWSVPTYDLAPSSISTDLTSSSSSSSSSSLPTSLPSDSSSKPLQRAPTDHISRAARSRYHLTIDSDIKKKMPFGQISKDLKNALGLTSGMPLPWLDRMRRYGWPPGFLIQMLKKKHIIPLIDAVDDDNVNASVKIINNNDDEDNNACMMEFPLYLWAPYHEKASEMFGKVCRPKSSTETMSLSTTSSIKSAVLVEWPPPI